MQMKANVRLQKKRKVAKNAKIGKKQRNHRM